MTNWDQVFEEFREESNKDKPQQENGEDKRPKEDF